MIFKSLTMVNIYDDKNKSIKKLKETFKGKMSFKNLNKYVFYHYSPSYFK